MRISDDKATFRCALPALPPPSAPQLPTYSTLRLEGEQSYGPVRKLVKFLMEWNHEVYIRWTTFGGKRNGDRVGEDSDESEWSHNQLLRFLESIYGDQIPKNGHPPLIPWDGQRAAAANAITQLVGRNQKYQEAWRSFSDTLSSQKGQCPQRQSLGTLHRFLSQMKGDLAVEVLASERNVGEISSGAGDDSPAAFWSEAPAASDGCAP
eukprot:3062557-Pyramimonas_sp.AAC.1